MAREGYLIAVAVANPGSAPSVDRAEEHHLAGKGERLEHESEEQPAQVTVADPAQLMRKPCQRRREHERARDPRRGHDGDQGSPRVRAQRI